MALPGEFNTGQHPYPNLSPPRIEDDVNDLFDLLKKDKEDFSSPSPTSTATPATTIDDEDTFEMALSKHLTSMERVLSQFKEIERRISSLTTKKKDRKIYEIGWGHRKSTVF